MTGKEKISAWSHGQGLNGQEGGRGGGDRGGSTYVLLVHCFEDSLKEFPELDHQLVLQIATYWTTHGKQAGFRCLGEKRCPWEEKGWKRGRGRASLRGGHCWMARMILEEG